MNIDSILISKYAVTDSLGHLTVVGVFNNLTVQGPPPWGFPFFCLSLVVHGHSKEVGTSHKGEIFLLDSERTAIIPEPFPFEFTFPTEVPPPGMPTRVIHTLTIMGPAFTKPGHHAFEVRIDGIYHASASLYVEKAKKG